ncbi:MAG TPA: hypothetical protein PK079_04245 [Leptospiraceae bacterium]|nr:hypothetical protein [Leptospiraceae bacterium]HMW05448.1 hypothetical protein [Leptospiraceae bacterium]HMX31403.1 hypothetical protein [Leptospiraceae bacterium]HMY30958.1 hypothetical protein [Leptospiraceae bacterium]HMZ63369.1 hypothetical protein [Leptospiraceae bacterium]
MTKYFFLIFFFLILTAVDADTAKRASSQTDVYIWGSIFLALSMGSLLLVVNLFPKGAAYKAYEARLQHLRNNPAAKPKSSNEENAPGQNTEANNLQTEIEKTNPQTKPANATAPVMQSTHTSVKVPETKPSIPAINPVPQQECVIINYNKVFESPSAQPETSCKDFVNKLSNIIKCKSISIYFVHNQVFSCFIEKKADIFTKMEAGKKSDLSDEILKFLKNKLGAFSSNHADAVLPLVTNNQLFGAVKLEFAESLANLDINPIWSEVKAFAKYFDQSIHYNLSVQDNETSLFTLEHFNNILNYRVSLDLPQNLSLIKILNTTDKVKTFKDISGCVKEVIGKKPEIYKLSDDLLGIFLTIEDRDKVSKSMGTLVNLLKKNIVNIEIAIGSADYNENIKFANKWHERATNALNSAIQAGKNNFRLFVEPEIKS